LRFPISYRATAPLAVLAFVANFNNFGVIYFLTEGGPANSNYQFAGSTDLLITWLFTLTVDNRLYNIGAVMSIVIFVLVGTFSLWISRDRGHSMSSDTIGTTRPSGTGRTARAGGSVRRTGTAALWDRAKTILIHIELAVLAVVVIYPLVWVVGASFGATG